MIFRKAQAEDVSELVKLINASYRTTESWTHECELLEGDRIGPAKLQELAENSHVEMAIRDGRPIACVHLDENKLGLLSVDPRLQGQGVARRLMRRAHELVRGWGFSSISLTVIADRRELIAYYERRGYRKTGRVLPFPADADVGTPKKELELLEMEYRFPPVGQHFILYVQDQKASRDFYRAVLGREPRLDVPGMTEFALAEHTVLGLMPKAGIERLLDLKTGTNPTAELYWILDDPESAMDRALQAGATLLSPFQSRNWGDDAGYLSDPDGHVLALASRRAQQ